MVKRGTTCLTKTYQRSKIKCVVGCLIPAKVTKYSSV